MKKLSMLCALFSLLVLCGCSQKDTPPTGSYVVTEIEGVLVSGTSPIFVVYADNKLVGKGPINNWTTPVLEDGKLGIIISTRMAGSSEQMRLEQKLLQALEDGTLGTGLHGNLVINKDGETVIVMEPSAEAQTTIDATN